MVRKIRPDWLLALLIALFIAWRVVLLVWSPFVFDEEEYKTGSIAHLVMTGPQLPVIELTPGDYEGGTLIAGLLAIPFFALLGHNFIALKMVAVSFSLLLLVSIYLLAKKLAGRTAAGIAGASLILAPPYISQITLLPWGNYAEAAALSALTFLVAAPMFEKGRRTPGLLMGLGFLTGLGTYIHYGYLAAPLTVCLMWLLRDRLRIFNWSMLLFMLGVLIGFSPWIYYNVTHEFWGLERMTDAFIHQESSGLQGLVDRLQTTLYRFAHLWLSDLPAALHFRDSLGLSRKFWAYLWYVPALAALVILTLQARQGFRALVRNVSWPKAGFRSVIPLYLLVYAIVFSFTDYGLFRSGWQTLDPESHAHIFVMLPWLAACLGFAAAWIIQNRKSKTLLVLLLAGPAIAGLVGQFSLLDLSSTQTKRLTAKAWDEGIIYVEIGSKWARQPDRLWEIGQKLQPRQAGYFSFGAGIKFGLDMPDQIHKALASCTAVDSRYSPYCAIGIGTGIYQAANLDLHSRRQSISETPLELAPYVEAGAAIGEIWLDTAEGPYCYRVKSYDFSNIAPQQERENLPRFIRLQLKMIEVLPPK